MNIAIITGASSGMGKEAAKQIDNIYTDGIDEIWLIARRTSRLENLSMCLKHKSRVFSLDLTRDSSFNELKLALNEHDPNVKMLVNAAGFGIIGDFIDSKYTGQSGMVRLNCEALTKVTHIVLNYMVPDSRIIQFASSAAFMPQSGFAVYAASKAYVLSFSRALNQELKKYNISVTAVCPGPVDTEFFDIAEKDNNSLAIKKYFMAKTKNVVKKAMIDSYHRKSVSIYSLPMQLFYILAKMIPHEFLLKIMALLK